MSLDAIVDTGFTGFLTLPTHVLQGLRASAAGTRRAQLGDGKRVEMAVYFVRVHWRGEQREVLAMQADATPLVGMAMLWGSRVAFDAEDGGAATIDSIP